MSDEEWALVAPYLALLRESSGQRDHDLREVFNGLRFIVKTGAPWRFMPHDLPPWAAVYQQTQRWLAGVECADARDGGEPASALVLPSLFGELCVECCDAHVKGLPAFTHVRHQATHPWREV